MSPRFTVCGGSSDRDDRPGFSDEYTSGMDSLILSSRYGKTRCARAKILASFLTAVTILIGTVAFIVLVTIGYFGTDGFAVDAHLCATGMIGMAPFALPYWKALLILISLGLGAIMMLIGFALAASALGTSSFISVLVTLAFLFCRSFCGECGIFRGSIISWNYVRGISFHLPKYLRFRHIRSEVTLFRSIRWKSWLQFVSPRSVLSVLILDSKTIRCAHKRVRLMVFIS